LKRNAAAGFFAKPSIFYILLSCSHPKKNEGFDFEYGKTAGYFCLSFSARFYAGNDLKIPLFPNFHI
jgi:hypothetical protein